MNRKNHCRNIQTKLKNLGAARVISKCSLDGQHFWKIVGDKGRKFYR